MKKKNTVVALVVLLTGSSVILVSPNNSVKLPPEVTSGVRSIAPESPASWGRTRVPTTQVPSPTKKPIKPFKTSIYVVSKGIDSYWGIGRAVSNWNNKLKWVSLRPVAACPSFQPCITFKYNPKLEASYAAETSFGYRNDLTIELNPVVKSSREALATATHELGHTLGVPHIIGTGNTVMNPSAVYRTTPSAIDVSYANQDTTWTVAEAYESSSKTVDSRAVPR